MAEPVVFFVWQTESEETTSRGKRWWAIASLIMGILFVISLFTANFAFAVMLVMFYVIFVLVEKNQAKMLKVVIADQGILVNTTLFPYGKIREFFIADDAHKLYINLNRVIGSHIHIPIAPDVDPGEIRLLLREFIVENTEQHEEPLLEVIARKLKIF